MQTGQENTTQSRGSAGAPVSSGGDDTSAVRLDSHVHITSHFAGWRRGWRDSVGAESIAAGLVLVLGLGFGLAGCSAAAPIVATPTAVGPANPSGTERVIEAEWCDVDASVDIGVSRVEMAAYRVNPAGEHYREYRFEIVSINERKGTLTVTRKDPPPAPKYPTTDRLGVRGKGAETMVLWSKIGVDGDSTAELALLKSIEDRLLQLKGKGSARLTDEAYEIKDK